MSLEAVVNSIQEASIVIEAWLESNGDVVVWA